MSSQVWNSKIDAFQPFFYDVLALASSTFFCVLLLVNFIRDLSSKQRSTSSRKSIANEDKHVRQRASIQDNDTQPLHIENGSNIASSMADPDRVGLSSPSSFLEAMLTDQIYQKQRAIFWPLLLFHTIVVVSCVSSALVSTHGYGIEGERHTWHGFAAPISNLVFWTMSALLLTISNQKIHMPFSATFHATWAWQTLVALVRFYSLLRSRKHNFHMTDDVAHQTIVDFSVYGYVVGIVFVFAVAGYDIISSRRLKAWELNAERNLLDLGRKRVIDWVNKGLYAKLLTKQQKQGKEQSEASDEGKKRDESPGHNGSSDAIYEDSPLLTGNDDDDDDDDVFIEFKRWEDMTDAERCTASELYAEKAFTKKIGLGMLFEMVMKVDAPYMVVGITGAIMNAVGQSVFPLIIGDVVSVIATAMQPGSSEQQGLDSINRVSVNFIYALIAIGFGRFLVNAFVEVAGSRVICRVQRLTFASMLQQDMTFFDKNKVGELTAILQTNPSMMRQGMTTSLANIFGGIVQLVMILVFMNHGMNVNDKYSTQLFGITVGLGTPALLAFLVLFSAVAHFTKKQTEKSALAGGVATEMISGIKTVVAYSMDFLAESKYSQRAKEAMNVGIQKDLLQSVCAVVIWWSWLGAQAGIYYFGARMCVKKELTLDFLVSFGGLFSQLMMAMLGIFSAIPGFGSAVGAADKIFKVMIRHPAISNVGGVKPTKCDGALALKDVSFAYPSKPDVEVLKDVSLEINKGTSVALVGESGCGKSTILSLLERQYTPTKGTVRLDGLDINLIDLNWLRQHIGVVAQEPILFSGTIEENILAGRIGYSHDDVVRAAKLADAHEFISKKQEGYQTEVSEGGASLSGGQKQRIAIARAILTNPQLLFFDEATSALDRTAQSEIQKAILSISEGRTSVTIAHNFNSIKDCDSITMIEKGNILDTGPHKELVTRCSEYKSLFETGM